MDVAAAVREVLQVEPDFADRVVRAEDERTRPFRKLRPDPVERRRGEFARHRVQRLDLPRVIERVEHDEIDAGERRDRVDEPRDERPLRILRPDLEELLAVVVVTHADRQPDARVHEELQFRIGTPVVLGTSLDVGEIAEDDDVPRQRVHPEDLGDGRRKPLAHARLHWLAGRVVGRRHGERVEPVHVHVRQEHGEILVEIRRARREKPAGRPQCRPQSDQELTSVHFDSSCMIDRKRAISSAVTPQSSR